MSKKVKLNVGGIRFETSAMTLSRYSGSMLARFIQQPNEIKMIDQGQELFIDRDGTHFVHILNYLRDGDSTALPFDNAYVCQAIIREAEFYKLNGLITFISRGGGRVGGLVKLDQTYVRQYVSCVNCNVSNSSKNFNFLLEKRHCVGKIKEITNSCAEVVFPTQPIDTISTNTDEVHMNIKVPMPLKFLVGFKK